MSLGSCSFHLLPSLGFVAALLLSYFPHSSPLLSSSFRGPGLAVFPGSCAAPQSVRAGGQLWGEPLCARCPGWQPGLVFLVGRWQCCDSLCHLRSCCHEQNQTAQAGGQETWRTDHLISGPALLKDPPRTRTNCSIWEKSETLCQSLTGHFYFNSSLTKYFPDYYLRDTSVNWR